MNFKEKRKYQFQKASNNEGQNVFESQFTIIIFECNGKTLQVFLLIYLGICKKVSQLLVKRKNDFSHRQSKAAKNI